MKKFKFIALALALVTSISGFGQEMNSLMFRAGVK